MNDKQVLQTVDSDKINLVSFLEQWAHDMSYDIIQKRVAAYCGYHIPLDLIKESIEDYIGLIDYKPSDRSANALTYVILTKTSELIKLSDMRAVKSVILRTVLESFIKYHREQRILRFSNLDAYISKFPEMYDFTEMTIVNELLYDKKLYLENNARIFDLMLRNNSFSYKRTLKAIKIQDYTIFDVDANIVPFNYTKSTTSESCFIFIDLANRGNKYILGLFDDDRFICASYEINTELEPINNRVDFSKSMAYKVINADTEDLLLEYNKFFESIFNTHMRNFHLE